MSWVEIKEPGKLMSRGSDARIVLERAGPHCAARCRVQVRKDLVEGIGGKKVAVFVGEGENAGKLRFVSRGDGKAEFKPISNIANYMVVRIGHIPQFPNQEMSASCEAEVGPGGLIVHLPESMVSGRKVGNGGAEKQHRRVSAPTPPKVAPKTVEEKPAAPKHAEPRLAQEQRPRRPRIEVAATTAAATAARATLAEPVKPSAPPPPPKPAAAPPPAPKRTATAPEETQGEFTFRISETDAVIAYRGAKIETTPRKARLVQLLLRAIPQPIGHSFLIGKLWTGRQPPDAHMMLSVMVRDLAEPLRAWGFVIKDMRALGINLAPI